MGIRGNFFQGGTDVNIGTDVLRKVARLICKFLSFMYGLGFPLDFCPGAGVEPTSRACSAIELSEYMRGGAVAPPGIERGEWLFNYIGFPVSGFTAPPEAYVCVAPFHGTGFAAGAE